MCVCVFEKCKIEKGINSMFDFDFCTEIAGDGEKCYFSHFPRKIYVEYSEHVRGSFRSNIRMNANNFPGTCFAYD